MQALRNKQAEQEEEGNDFRFTVECSLLQVYQDKVYDMLEVTWEPLQLQAVSDKPVEVKGLHKEAVTNGASCNISFLPCVSLRHFGLGDAK